MKDQKFLSDGRKVAVIGSLNEREFVVQEIFVTKDGDEIPSGERFVAKSLHDKPVRSHKEMVAEKIEQRISKLKGEEDRLKNTIRELENQKKNVSATLQCSRHMANGMTDEDWETFVMFATGQAKWFVLGRYSIEKPMTWEQIISRHNDRMGFEDLKLLSLFGKSDGSMLYKVNQYYDGSGGWSNVYPFPDYASAVAKVQEIAQERLDNDRLTVEDFIKTVEMGISWSQEVVDGMKEKAERAVSNTIARCRESESREVTRVQRVSIALENALSGK